MMTWIRRRLSREDGVSLVEMLVAIFILSVALFALLGGLITSARSLADQRSRSAATRVASEHLEELRAQGFDALRASASPVTVTRTLDGRTYTITTTLQEEDADPATAGGPTVMRVTATVSWTVGTVARSEVHTTAVAPDPGSIASGGSTPAQRIVSVNLNPNPTVIDAAGNPTRDVSATVVLDGFDDQAYVALTWVNDGGGTKTQYLTSTDGGITWVGVVSRTDIVRVIAPGETSPGLDFTVSVGSPTSLSQPYTLSLTAQSSSPPTITSASISVSQITVENHNNCNGPNKCRNTVAVTFSATVDGINPAQDSVRVKYQLYDGTFEERPLRYDDPATGGSGAWVDTVAVLTVKFKQGPSQPFEFTVLRSADNASTSTQLTRPVVAQ